jgi:cytochrome-b5 reductase
MSQKLAAMKVGDIIWAKPPHKTTSVPHWPNGKSEVTLPSYGFIAGGTGIAPVYQLILRILERLSEGAAPKLTLLFSNRLEQDVLLYKELKQIEAKHPENFNFEFTLTGEKKEGFRFGRVNSEMVSELFPRSTIDHVFVSGPAGMWESVYSLLQAIGFSESDCTELEA